MAKSNHAFVLAHKAMRAHTALTVLDIVADMLGTIDTHADRRLERNAERWAQQIRAERNRMLTILDPAVAALTEAIP